jgi:hypothetical protein
MLEGQKKVKLKGQGPQHSLRFRMPQKVFRTTKLVGVALYLRTTPTAIMVAAHININGTYSDGDTSRNPDTSSGKGISRNIDAFADCTAQVLVNYC